MYPNINQDQDRALPGGEQRFPPLLLGARPSSVTALAPTLGRLKCIFSVPSPLSLCHPSLHTAPSWRARGSRLQGALFMGRNPTSRSSDGSPLARVAGLPDHTASPTHPSPFVSRVFARICHVHLTQIPFGARQARLAPSCIQARAWLPSTGDRSSRIASTLSPRRVDQLG